MLSQLRADRSKEWKDRWHRLLETVLTPKFKLRLYLVVMLVGLVFSRSRMGNTAFFGSVTLCGVLALYFQHRYRKQRVNRNIIVFLSAWTLLTCLLLATGLIVIS
jgi:hypothetical protein